MRDGIDCFRVADVNSLNEALAIIDISISNTWWRERHRYKAEPAILYLSQISTHAHVNDTRHIQRYTRFPRVSVTICLVIRAQDTKSTWKSNCVHNNSKCRSRNACCHNTSWSVSSRSGSLSSRSWS